MIKKIRSLPMWGTDFFVRDGENNGGFCDFTDRICRMYILYNNNVTNLEPKKSKKSRKICAICTTFSYTY